jgi:hypothetical protein
MNVKATLLCEDVRMEASGTLTLVGVINEQLVGPPGNEPLPLPRLVFFVVVAGLRGTERVGYRQYVRRADAPEPERAALRFEPHHPEADEHNFVFGPVAVTVDRPGTFELVVELQARDESLVHRYQFHIERAAS